jgi:hypothetical protein
LDIDDRTLLKNLGSRNFGQRRARKRHTLFGCRALVDAMFDWLTSSAPEAGASEPASTPNATPKKRKKKPRAAGARSGSSSPASPKGKVPTTPVRGGASGGKGNSTGSKRSKRKRPQRNHLALAPRPPTPSEGTLLIQSPGTVRPLIAGKPPVENVRRARATKKLVVRESVSLSSKKVTDVPIGKTLVILEERVQEDGVVRARIGLDSSPRGLALIKVGWVTAEKDGELKLAALISNRGEHAVPSTSVSPGAASVDSLASRVAHRRQEAADDRAERRGAEEGEGEALEAEASEQDGAATSGADPAANELVSIDDPSASAAPAAAASAEGHAEE